MYILYILVTQTGWHKSDFTPPWLDTFEAVFATAGQPQAQEVSPTMVINRLSVLVSGFRMDLVSSVQRQWWFQDVSGHFRVGG